MSNAIYKAHLCLVSTQPLPNLVPVCDPDQKPQKVVLLVSDHMLPQAEWLEQVLVGRKIESERWHIQSPYDVDHIRQRLGKLLDRPDMRGVALNVTGGTKIMALAAFELFRERGLPIFYVQPHKDLLLPLYPAAPPREIPDCLTLEEFLAAHGYQVTSLRRYVVDSGQSEVGQRLVNHVTQYGAALGALNYLAGTAEDRSALDSEPVSPSHWGLRGLESFLIY